MEYDLRALLAAPKREPGPFAVATYHAGHRVGADVAAAIHWDTHSQDVSWGRLTGANGDTLTLRFENTEPGAEQLEVSVPCPADPRCRDAYDVVGHPAQLLAVLDGAPEAEGNVRCYTHDDDF